MQVYHGHFKSKEDVMSEFGLAAGSLDEFEVLYAEYSTASYEGDAFVLLRRGDDLFEVNASHCSCNGLESAWRLEPTTKKALLARPNVVENVKGLMRLMVLT